MEYFGTSLTEAGHYRWDLSGGHMRCVWLRFEDLPFNPEALIKDLPKGETVFYQGGGFTVIAIAGSCKDGRPGSKSIFWVKENIYKAVLIQRIMENETAMKIIKAMPFEVNWGVSEKVD